MILFINQINAHCTTHQSLNLAHRFARNYLKIAEAYLFIDREPALSIMDVSGIIFSISVISNQLISETPIMASIICFIKAYFLMGPLSFDTIFDSYSQSKRLKLKDYPYLECTSSNYRHPRYWRLFSDFHCLLSACRAAGNGTTQRGGIATDYFRQLGDLIRNNSASTNATTPSALRDLKLLIDLLSMFQEMNMQKRQHDSHVEYEDESWVDAFNLTLRLMNTIKVRAYIYLKIIHRYISLYIRHLVTKKGGGKLRQTPFQCRSRS